MAGRVVLHVDMNAYFTSVEQRANPLLRGKPVVVVGDMHRRSVVLTASYEARPFGVRTGWLLREALAVCPGLIPVQSDPEKYRAASEEIRETLLRFSDRVEMTSCDEAFLDVTPASGEARPHDGGRPASGEARPHEKGRPASGDGVAEEAALWKIGEAQARRLQDAVLRDVGLPCSVGVSPNKLLSKLASDHKKPNGITVLRPSELPAFLEDTPVEALCGVGLRLKESLGEMGLRTCGELGRADFERLYTRFGIWGHWLKRMGQGLDDAPVARADAPETVKSVGHSMTFSRNTDDPEVLKGYLLHLVEKVGRRLRRGGWAGRCVSVWVRFADFTGAGKQALSKEPTDDDGEVYRRAVRVLEGLGPLPKPVRLVAVSVSSLERAGGGGYLLEELEKDRRRSRAMDRINGKYGDKTLRRARVALAEKHGLLEGAMPLWGPRFVR
jgi:DNA polymerase-4